MAKTKGEKALEKGPGDYRNAIPSFQTMTCVDPASAKVVWRPQPGPQTLALLCPIFEILFGGQRGGGKTDCLLGKWVKHSAQAGRYGNGLILRQSVPELRHIIYRSAELYAPIGATFSTQSRTWLMPNGSRLHLGYLRNEADASQFHGHGLNFVAVDEVGNYRDQRPIDMLSGAMRSAEGVQQCKFLTCNPGGVGHNALKERYITDKKPFTAYYRVPTLDGGYEYFRQGQVPKELEGHGIWQVFIPSKLSDNKILVENDPDYTSRIRASGTPALVRAWLEGDWDVDLDGEIFTAEHLHYYDKLPAGEPLHVLQSWDTAYSLEKMADYSVCTTWGIWPSGVYLMHVRREKMDFPTLTKWAIELAQAYKCWDIVIEKKASGISLIQQLVKDTGLPIRGVSPIGDKVLRASLTLQLWTAGLVKLPKSAPWLREYLAELLPFPNVKHDDQVDSTSQALLEVGKRLVGLFTQSGTYTPLSALSPEPTEAQTEAMKKATGPDYDAWLDDELANSNDFSLL